MLPVTPASGVPGGSPTCIDGWWWWWWWWMVVVVDGQAKLKKSTYFKNFSKTTRYFFLVVSRPLRRVLKTFSEQNWKKNIIFIFVKKFRTTFFFQRFFRFFDQDKHISQKLLFFFLVVLRPFRRVLKNFFRKTRKKINV